MCELNDHFHQYSTPKANEIFATEILNDRDSRAYYKYIINAKRAEIKKLLETGTFRIIQREDVPPDGNILPDRLVLIIKSTDDRKIKYKADM